MLYFKNLVLVAIAAAILTTFLGASTASATVLCRTNMEAGCAAAGWDYGSGTNLGASLVGTSTYTSLTTTTTYTTCTGSNTEGKLASTGGASEAVVVLFEVATWSGCSATVHALEAGTWELHWKAGTDDGTVVSQNLRATENIFGSCIYGTGEGTELGTLKGGPTPSLTIHAAVKRLNACFGPLEREWNATYHVTTPTPIYVAES